MRSNLLGDDSYWVFLEGTLLHHVWVGLYVVLDVETNQEPLGFFVAYFAVAPNPDNPTNPLILITEEPLLTDAYNAYIDTISAFLDGEVGEAENLDHLREKHLD